MPENGSVLAIRRLAVDCEDPGDLLRDRIRTAGLRYRPPSPAGTGNASLRKEADEAVQKGRWSDAEALLSRVSDPTPDDWLRRAVVATSLNQPEAAIRYLARISPDGPLAARVALVTSRAELCRFRARPMEDALHSPCGSIRRSRRPVDRSSSSTAPRGAVANSSNSSPPLLRRDRSPSSWSTTGASRTRRRSKSPTTSGQPWSVSSRATRTTACRDSAWPGSIGNSAGSIGRRIASPALPESDPDARASRAETEFDRGDMEAVRRLLADGPSDHPKLARLRGHLALNRQDGAEAVRWFRLSDAAEPNRGETLYGLAQALRVVGDRAAAEPYARRAEAQRVLRDHLTNLAANREPRPIVCCRLLRSASRPGISPEARAWYRLAIAYDPTNQQAQRALFRLTSSRPVPEGLGPPDARTTHSERN